PRGPSGSWRSAGADPTAGLAAAGGQACAGGSLFARFRSVSIGFACWMKLFVGRSSQLAGERAFSGRSKIMNVAGIGCAALLAFGIVGLPGSAGAANLVTNGSFESTTTFVDNSGDGAMELHTGASALTGWTITAPGDDVAWIGPTNPWLLNASDGGYFLDLTGFEDHAPFGGVTQMIATIPGVHYLLNFDLGSSNIQGVPVSITASAGGVSEVFISALNGVNNWQPETLNFTASSDTTLISFQGEAGRTYIGLDNVSVTDPPAAVPEPMTWALLLCGMGFLGAFARATRRAVATAA
ncbi:MAG: DUF642 domain-containing protein, partial [Caulobacteraceae bacterium]